MKTVQQKWTWSRRSILFDRVMAMLDQIMRMTFAPVGRQFQRDIRHPEEAKALQWESIWRLVGTSPFWRQHGRSPQLEEFPIREYEEFRPSIELGFNRGTSQLSTQPVLYYATTGATTSKKPKRFPLTASYRRQMKAVGSAYAWSVLQRTSDLKFAGSLTLTSSAPQTFSPHGIPIGYASWYALHLQGALGRWISPIPNEVLADDSVYQEWGPLYALSRDLGQLAAVNASKLRTFAQHIEQRLPEWQSYLDGKPLPHGLPPLKVPTQRQKLLLQAFKRPQWCFADVWPSLRNISCWRAGVSRLQLPCVQRWVSDVPLRDAPLACTEAWLTVPLWDDRVGGPLHTGANIVEMLPVGSTDLSDILQPWELVEGEDYELLLTTSMGLVRYRVHDVVRCTGFVERSPVLVFRHKTAFTLRLGQVSIAESDLTDVLADLGQQPARTWCVVSNRTGDGLRVLIKGEGDHRSRETVAAESDALSRVLPPLDQRLRDLLPVYDHDRQVGWMKSPTIELVAADHEIWDQPAHAQAKPKLLLPTFID